MGLGATAANTALNAGEEVFDNSSDEDMDEEAKARHQEFKGKRKEHYSKEAAFAMKKARELLEKEDAEEEAGEGGMDQDEVGDEERKGVNGVVA